MKYTDFLERKSQLGGDHGFEPKSLPSFLYGFQTDLVLWSLRKGRSAIFADCGLGKTPMQLVWANKVAEHTGKPGLIATPLAVSHQLIRESEKFGINAARSQDGSVSAEIMVTNYERLGAFNPADFSGMVCDESSILKNFNGIRRTEITGFMRKMPYRLLCTATAAPNDYTELGTSSEALGEMGFMDMLGRFFKNTQNTSDTKTKWRTHGGGSGPQWRFKGHAEDHFWKWVCSWARACRRPSDLGYSDQGFDLPPLIENEHIVEARTQRAGQLFSLPSANFFEEREERRRTIGERCEKVASLVDTGKQALVWCHLNDEGDLLKNLIPGSEQIRGSDSDEKKEGRLIAFQRGELRVLVTKPKIGAWGLNLQSCSHVTAFPSHSYEQYYQGIRRCWRFGQKNGVVVDMVATDGEIGVKKNLQRKAKQADRMFSALVEHMYDSQKIDSSNKFDTETEAPEWL